jgi:hypothetical protein
MFQPSLSPGLFGLLDHTRIPFRLRADVFKHDGAILFFDYHRAPTRARDITSKGQP